ncbi:hypothetical protein ACOSQ4_029154 [Xanthoceras sorbifolium]
MTRKEENMGKKQDLGVDFKEGNEAGISGNGSILGEGKSKSVIDNVTHSPNLGGGKTRVVFDDVIPSGEGVEVCTKFKGGVLGNKCDNIEMPLCAKKKSAVYLDECKDIVAEEDTACLINDAATTSLVDSSSISGTILYTLNPVDVCVTSG